MTTIVLYRAHGYDGTQKCGQIKWRDTPASIFCDNRVSIRLKGKLYNSGQACKDVQITMSGSRQELIVRTGIDQKTRVGEIKIIWWVSRRQNKNQYIIYIMQYKCDFNIR